MAKDYVYEPERGETTALARTDAAPAEVVPIHAELEPVSLRDTTFAKSGSKPLDAKQAKVLRAKIDEEDEADILPTGEVYMSHVYVRRRLNDAVGPMGWALRPVSQPDTKSVEGTMYREFALIVLGRVVATAFGSAKYYTKSARMDFADTAEAVKSNALTRCCKDLGIGSECWDRRWIERWKDKYAVHVWTVEERWDREKRANVKENAARWRRIDAKPFPKEFDIVRDSPNQEAWRKQWDGWIAMLDREAERSRETVKRMREAKQNLHVARKEEQQARGGDQPAQQQPREEARQAGPSQTNGATQHRQAHQISNEDRPYVIRNCKIAQQSKPTPENPAAKSYTLYAITMMDGTEYLTFSSSVYRAMQMVLASGKRVQIKPEIQKVGGKTVAHVKDFRIEDDKRGWFSAWPKEREAGQEG